MRWRAILAMALPVAVTGCARTAPTELRLEGATMGTTYVIEVFDPPAGMDATRLRAAVDGALVGIERSMSTYDPDSELSRFNADGGSAWFPVSPETGAVVAAALDVHARTGGAFDVTVGPLVDLWGFGPGGGGSRGEGRRPSPAEIRAALARVGAAQLQVRTAPPALRKLHPGVRVDLSGIAKGFAVDEVARVLANAGARRYLVEIGGELRASGTSAAGRPWRILVERPAAAVAPLCLLELSDGAVATSGDYRNAFVEAGVRYSHVLDPRSGEPVRTGVVSATVLAPTAMEADAMATALLVLSLDEGLALAAEEGLAARWLVREGGALVERRTPGFPCLPGGRP